MLKDWIKKALRLLPFDLTANLRYDRLTRQLIQRHCGPQTNSVDVGCHKGEILDLILAQAPRGQHHGFEPLPHLFAQLQKKYADKTNVSLHSVALSNTHGSAQFNYVISNPSYSGLLKRRYDRPNEQDTLIEVQTRQLDELLPPDFQLDLMKIDVEGAELLVLEGARRTIARCKPLVIFEYGLGASDVYGATPDKMWDFFASCGMRIYLPDDYLSGRQALTLQAFTRQYTDRINCYFVAA